MVSSFSLSGASSPSADVTMPARRVTLASHGANTSSLALLHLLGTLRPVASHLELKTKY
jgi:hypothetical protein